MHIVRNLIIAAITSATLLAGTSHAQDAGKVYANLGYSFLAQDDVDLGAITARLGYDFTPNFAIEGEAGVGVSEESVLGVKIKVDSSLGAFLVGKVPVGENFELLGRMGYNHTWLSAKGFGASADADDGSFGVGIGAQYLFDGKNGIRGDYTRYTEGDGTDVFSINYVRKF
jgi:outer membrane immunogenic protein